MLTQIEIDEMRPRLISWAAMRLGDDGAEDAAQETLLRACMASGLGGAEDRRGYVFGILKHVVSEAYAAREQDARAAAQFEARLTEQAEREAVHAPDLDGLPLHLHQALELRLCGLTFAEIGAARGISPRAARYRVQAGVECVGHMEIELGYRSAEEMFSDCARQYVYRAPQTTGSGLSRKRLGRLK